MLKAKNRIAQLAGISIFIIALLAVFIYECAFENLFVFNNKAATISKLQESKWLFKSVIVSFILIASLDGIVTRCFFTLFTGVNKSISLFTVWLRLAYLALLCTFVFHLFSIPPLLNQELPDEDAVMCRLVQFLHVEFLSVIILSAHMLFLGIVVYRSVFMPKRMGMITMLAAVFFILINIVSLYIPGSKGYREIDHIFIALPLAAGELIVAVSMIRISLKKNINFNITT